MRSGRSSPHHSQSLCSCKCMWIDRYLEVFHTVFIIVRGHTINTNVSRPELCEGAHPLCAAPRSLGILKNRKCCRQCLACMTLFDVLKLLVCSAGQR